MPLQFYIKTEKSIATENGSDIFRPRLTSASLFILAFIISQIIFILIKYKIAAGYGYDILFTYNKFNITRDYHKWDYWSILSVYFLPSTFCMAISIGIYILFLIKNKWINSFRLFLFWLMVCLSNIFLSGFLTALLGYGNYTSVFYENYAVLCAWLHLKIEVVFFIAGLFFIFSILSGVIIGSEFLKFPFEQKLLNSSPGKDKLVLNYFIIPVLTGIPFLLLLGDGLTVLKIASTLVNLLVISVGMIARNSRAFRRRSRKKYRFINIHPYYGVAMASLFWLLIFLFFK